MFLSDSHRKDLIKSGLTPETIQAAGFFSAPEPQTRSILGYGVGTGMVIPYKPWRDGQDEFARVKIDHPGPDGKKYRSPRGSGGNRSANRVYVPPILDRAVLTDSTVTLYVTEGEKKALKATQEGFPCIALAGVWSWKRRLHGKSLVIPDFDFIEWRNRLVVVVFDSDAADKPPVQWAEHALIQELRHRGADVYLLRLPEGDGGAKCGLDDYLVAEGPDALRALPMLSVAEADSAQPTFMRMDEIADRYLARALTMHHRLKMNWGVFDDVIRGIAPGEVMTILGRAGVGKTAFVLNMLDYLTTAERVPTLMVSLEMQAVELFERVASMTLGKAGREIEELATREDEWLLDALKDDVIPKWNHVVVTERPVTITKLHDLIGEARRGDFGWLGPLRVVVIDYLGMIGSGKRGSTYEQVSEVAREVKNIAKIHDVSIILLAQVGRDGDSGGEPVTLRSGRDSGVIEEAADYMLGIWRPALMHGLKEEDRVKAERDMVVRVLKNRCGPAPRTFKLDWHAQVLRISGGVEVDADMKPVPRVVEAPF